ncbi:hypothetical protein GCM10011492_28820 [Flexivirga endophytica]|uniref:Isochorismatase-like domain-containing protein n=2 Tax=Flexivirga endophytica TaxID=1849103 RepID=A0A916T958_9MICO|nr:hypothetical protein GCM10011492_28820 [Flexivirga endophytica]
MRVVHTCPWCGCNTMTNISDKVLPSGNWPRSSRADVEPLVEKTDGDSFEGTDLEEVLSAARVGHLVVSGAQTDMCIRSTIHGAFARGYDVTLVADAHTTEDLSSYGAPTPDLVIAHTNLYWQEQAAPGRRARTVRTAEFTFDAADADQLK